ncbi:MAG: LacI family DNA-binding transcriptional regulator [Akkermansia sp.]
MKRVTIKDLASKLNISVSTVSRALSGDSNIKSETRQLVVDLAKQLGYKRNDVAANLKSGRSQTIGVLVPEMITPFSSMIIKGIQQVLKKEHIKLIIAESGESWEEERENIAMMEKFMVDGLMVNICNYHKNREEYTRLQQQGMPLVFFDRLPHKMGVSKVVIDDYIKSFFLVEHLIQQGNKRIVYLQGPDHVYNSIERARGYHDALSKHKIPASPEPLVQHSLSFDDGHAAVKELLARGVEFDAILAFTDTLAIGALNELQAQGIAVPDQVSVAGFSGTVLSTIVSPALTTVEAPLEEMGINAAKLILERIENPKAPIRSIVLDATTIYRQSTR